jgi:asparagine synthase (glutamine-hydrolysing)
LKFNGSFALVIETPDIIFASVDLIRSIPLFYHSTDSGFLLSDNPDPYQKELQVTFSQESAVEFLCSGFVSGNNTLLNEINQIEAGEFIILNKQKEKLSSQRYFWNFNNSSGNGQVDIDNNSFENGQIDLVYKLDTVLNNCFNRCIQSTINEGKKIVVPLSGGLDSRIVVSMLKRWGIHDVICFTYGKSSRYETKISKKIAEMLHYEWHIIEYNRDNWNDCFKSQEMISHLDYSHNFVSAPPLQDFLAVKILKEEGIIPENSVFLPGHGIFRKNHFIRDFVLEHESDRENCLKS